jgi:hypothetical protein
MNKKIYYVLIVIVGSCVVLNWLGSRPGDSIGTVPSLPGAKAMSYDIHHISQSPLGQPLITADELLVGAALSEDKKELTLRYEETIPGTSNRETWESQHGTTFQITALAARQSNEFIVAGKTSANEVVVEKWTNGEPKGSHFLHVAPSQTVIGVSLLPVPQIISGIVGGQYIPVSSRARTQRQQREELFRGSLNNGILAITPDPEGRFFVVLTDSPRAVYRLDPPSQVPTLLCDVSMLPELSTAHDGGMIVSQHVSEGRLYFLTSDGSAPGGGELMYIKISDADNDGIFEGTSTVSYGQFLSEGSNPVWLQPDFLDFSGH